MKKAIIIGSFLIGTTVVSCSKDSCKECTNCQTLPSTTLCEDAFEKTSNYEDQVQNYESDGCTCSTKQYLIKIKTKQGVMSKKLI